jgi:hypothetical protein
VTHDQGVIAILTAGQTGAFEVEIIDRKAGTIFHEVELADLDGDGVKEIYATRSLPNRADGASQPGDVLRYTPGSKRGAESLVELGDRHAKEILGGDLDGDGTDELYIVVEGGPRNQVEIWRHDLDGESMIAHLPDMMCRFLTSGDVDGDGELELVAATRSSGLWLLRPLRDRSPSILIDSTSSGVEHAAALLDLDDDDRAELYVASDDQGEIRRYSWVSDTEWRRETLKTFSGDVFITWSIMSAPVSVLLDAARRQGH